jgi:hypothetical protein
VLASAERVTPRRPKDRWLAVSMQRHRGGNSCVPLDRCFPFGNVGGESTRPLCGPRALSALAEAAETELLWNSHYASDVRLKALDKSEWRPTFRGLLLLVPYHSCQRCEPLRCAGLVREWRSSASTSCELPQGRPTRFSFRRHPIISTVTSSPYCYR